MELDGSKPQYAALIIHKTVFVHDIPFRWHTFKFPNIIGGLSGEEIKKDGCQSDPPVQKAPSAHLWSRVCAT